MIVFCKSETSVKTAQQSSFPSWAFSSIEGTASCWCWKSYSDKRHFGSSKIQTVDSNLFGSFGTGTPSHLLVDCRPNLICPVHTVVSNSLFNPPPPFRPITPPPPPQTGQQVDEITKSGSNPSCIQWCRKVSDRRIWLTTFHSDWQKVKISAVYFIVRTEKVINNIMFALINKMQYVS